MAEMSDRYDPASAAWARFQQPHDVHLTVDANLQLRVAAIRGLPGHAAYCASKGAVVQMTTRSGTSQFHGGARYFRRDGGLNRRRFAGDARGRGDRDRLGRAPG